MKTKKTSTSSEKNSSTEKKIWKNYHYIRMCPIPNCMKASRQMNEHLHKFHRLEKNSDFYKLLEKAERYYPDLLPLDIMFSPRKKYGLAPLMSEKESKTSATVREATFCEEPDQKEPVHFERSKIIMLSMKTLIII